MDSQVPNLTSGKRDLEKEYADGVETLKQVVAGLNLEPIFADLRAQGFTGDVTYPPFATTFDGPKAVIMISPSNDAPGLHSTRAKVTLRLDRDGTPFATGSTSEMIAHVCTQAGHPHHDPDAFYGWLETGIPTVLLETASKTPSAEGIKKALSALVAAGAIKAAPVNTREASAEAPTPDPVVA
jgi:hypothetical protein